ncbi:hypothetical protein B0T14DRAFT_15338 [Immersiella caudata]|uniref:Uncharacterized protein n=1 Tax=Immersiella caudata TaxID=314043 RepID=A0AA40CC27_9PEZI|nr:hypothetical protein B0T14DRAFT_15338 [Immersiella caudata]
MFGCCPFDLHLTAHPDVRYIPSDMALFSSPASTETAVNQHPANQKKNRDVLPPPIYDMTSRIPPEAM